MVRCVGGMTSSAVANGAEASRDGIPEAYRLVRLPTADIQSVADHRRLSRAVVLVFRACRGLVIFFFSQWYSRVARQLVVDSSY